MMSDSNIEILNIKTDIESMNKFHQVEILKILKQNNVILNENKNGVFVNLSEIGDESLKKLKEYILYVNIQENQLSKLEDKKEQFKNDFYSNVNNIFKKHKVKNNIINNDSTTK